MSNTITPPGGNSTQSLQTQALLDQLRTMGPIPQSVQPIASAADTAGANIQQMTSAYPQVQQDWRNTLATQGQFPQAQQAAGGMSDAYKLFLQDIEMGKKYGAVNQPTPNDAPLVPGITDTAPLLTKSLNDVGFSGLTNPYLADTYYSGGVSNAAKALSSILSGASSFNLNRAQDLLGQSSDVYSKLIEGEKNKQATALDALKGLISGAQSNRAYELDRLKTLADLQSMGYSLDENGNPVPSAQGSDSVENYVKLIKNGSYKISNVPEKMKTAVTNRLAQEGYDGQRVAKLSDLQDASDVIDQAKALFYATENQGGLAEGAIPGTLAKIGAKMDLGPNADAINTYESYRKGVATTLRGIVKQSGALSVSEVANIVNLLPSASDKPKVAEQKFSNLTTLLAKKKGETIPGPGVSSGKSTMISPNGKKYLIDNSEVAEAEANGWKKQ